MFKSKYKNVWLFSLFIAILIILVTVKNVNSPDENNIDFKTLQREINEKHLEFKTNYKGYSGDIESLQFEYTRDMNEFTKYGFNEEDLINDFFKTDINIDYTKTITKDEAIEDINAMFFLLKNTYSAYNYFGGIDTFETAQENIINTINSGEDKITIQELNEIIIDNLIFIEDGHFSVGKFHTFSAPSIKYSDSNYQKLLYVADDFILEKEKDRYYFKDGFKKAYITSIDNDENIENYIYPIITETGEIKYTIAKLNNFFTENEDTNDILMAIYSKVYYENTKGNYSEEIKLNAVKTGDYSNLAPIETKLNAVKTGDYNTLEPVETKSEGNNFIITVRNFINDNPLLFLGTAGEAKDYDNIIIDARSSMGGSDEYIKPWITLVTGISNFDEYSSSEVLRMSNITSQSTDWDYINHKYYYEELIPNDKNIYILYDKGNTSSGESLMEYFKNVENVVLIGSNSGGVFFNGNLQLFKLPNSQLLCVWGNTLFIDDLYNLPEGIGCMPDIVVPNIEDSLKLTLKMIEYYDE